MTREAQTTQGKTQRIWTSTQKNETKQSSSMSNPLHMKTLLCNSRPWSSTETHPPTTELMPEKLGKDSNPNPNLELLSMAETGKPKIDEEAPTETRMGDTLATSSSFAEVATAPVHGSTPQLRSRKNQPYSTKYTSSRNGYVHRTATSRFPQPPEPTRPPEVRGNRRNRRQKLGRSRFTLFY